MEPKTIEALGGILSEVNRQNETKWRERVGESAEDRRKRVDDLIADWHRQILRRAKGILNERQYEEFLTIQQRNRDRSRRPTDGEFRCRGAGPNRFTIGWSAFTFSSSCR